jgi:hypothetical protein
MKRAFPKLLIAIIAFVVLVSMGVGGFVWWKTAPPPRIDTVAALIKAREAIQPEGEDAWPRYVAFFRDTLEMERFGERDASDLSQLYFRIGSSDFAILTAGDWDDPRLGDAKAMLREARPIVEALRYATDAPACRAPIMTHDTLLTAAHDIPIESGDETSGGPLDAYAAMGYSQFARFILLFVSEARDAFESGDFPRYTDAIRRLFVIADHVGSAPFFPAFRSRFEAETMTYRSIGLLALEGDMPMEWVDVIIAIIDSPARAMPLRDFLLATAEVTANIEMQLFSRELRAPSELLQSAIYAWSHPSPREIAVRRADSVRKAAEFVDLPIADLVSRGLPKDYLLSNRNSDISRAARNRGRVLSTRTATRIILLLERHHALTGEWPASLEDIMPREDTLDPNTLTPFVYERTPGGPFPFSLVAPPEAADFLPADQRLFTQPRRPIDEQNLSIEAAP